MQDQRASTHYEKLRDEVRLQTLRKMAYYTIPQLQSDPARRTNNAQQVVADFQSIGSLLVNSLANKLAMSLFPVGRPSFRIVLTEDLQAQAQQAGTKAEDLATGLSKVEQEASKRVFLKDGLSCLTYILKLLIVTGQCLVYRDPSTSKMTVWNSEHFVTRRDPMGELKSIILKQCFQLKDLPEDRVATLRRKRAGQYSDDSAKVDLFTVIRKDPDTTPNTWVVTEEIDGEEVSEESRYPVYLCPWIVPTWSVIAGDNFARGWIEEYAGDFAKLSMLSEALSVYTLESLSVLHLVDESAGGIIDEYAEADNGSFVSGKVDSIKAYESGDYNKIAAVQAAIQEITQRLSQAFGYTGQFRDSERTTAAEIMKVAQEADSLLGGAYSTLAYTLQTPLMYLSMYELSPELLMGILSEDIRPEILTGTAALGRASDSQNLLEAAQLVGTIVPPLAQSSSNLDPNKIVAAILRNSGVDIAALTKSAEQLQQEAAAQENAAAMQQQAAAQMINPQQLTQAGQTLNGA